MRRPSTSWYVAPLVGAAVLGAGPAAAQVDIDPPLPNVLLLIDSSGSMERMIDGTLPATCTPTTDNTSDLNRWGTLATVLTGTVTQRGCYAQRRHTTGGDNSFETEFSIGGVRPHDYGYRLPHHRIVAGANQCVMGVGTWPVATANGVDDVYEWPANAIACHKYDDPSTACNCDTDFVQESDGLMDVFASRVRFGLMTFDSHADGGTGLSGGAVNAQTGFDGLWSYYDGWQASGAVRQGRPHGCGTWSDFEVGARNPAAPPWEGRLIAMGKPDADDAHILSNNKVIQKALLAMRPYGATPLAGMMDDARYFLKTDSSNFVDPTDSNEYPGPPTDPYFLDGCRGNYIILLSDGEPNLDLRPGCLDSGAASETAAEADCPYKDEPDEVAYELANTGDPLTDVKTFVIGFGLSSDATFDCNDIDPATDFEGTGACVSASGAEKACCTLAKIAWRGGTDKAYFVDDLPTLRKALSNVLTVIAAGSTSRTLPAFAGGSAVAPAGAPAKSYEFVSSFVPNVGEGITWEGVLERKRWVCIKDTTAGTIEPELQDVDVNAGDRFSQNINANTWPRKFYTVFGTADTSGTIFSERTIRPHIGSNSDVLGTYSGTEQADWTEAEIPNLTGLADAMGIEGTTPECNTDDMGWVTDADECAERLMTWHLGGDNGTVHSREGHVLGAIYHSTPVVHGNPSVYLRDESYAVFADTNTTRPLMLYTATTDGQLHAFKVAPNDATETEADRLVDKEENNELWSFIPPYVLPNMMSMYPGNQQILLDGQVVVKDVVFQRTAEQARAGGDPSTGAQWNTVIVGSGGAAGGFYYALDVTDPLAPTFLWQLSTDDAGNPLFSDYSTTPAIATIALEQDLGNGGPETTEVAVAILPGGKGEIDGAPSDPNCGQRTGTFTYIDEPDEITTKYRPRSQVRCWQSGPARSLTIVRLSDGEVLARFLGEAADELTSVAALRRKTVGFGSPIVGTPVPFPSQTGDVADRIYVGDADGTLWRVDLSSPNPDNWTAHLMFDGYPLSTDTSTDGEPVDIAPVVATDGIGNAVVLFATGDQETFAATATMKTRIWSITEIAEAGSDGTPFKVEHNWVIPFANGKRVTGPIAIFDEVAYFATFTPVPLAQSSDVCTDGYGSIWGVDFMLEEDSTTPPYPEARLEEDPGSLTTDIIHEDAQEAGVVVFGVAVIQVPSCYETEDYTDSWAGGATRTGIGISSPPQYQLVYQTGRGGSSSGAITKTARRVLPPLDEMARIDSWASIIE